MQTLPTAVTTENLNNILASLEGLPSAEVTRHADVVTVHATKRATGARVQVLRAVTRDGKYWHVMTVLGLLKTVFAPSL
jgi:hypothetical protein